jgi:hypothetical protein
MADLEPLNRSERQMMDLLAEGQGIGNGYTVPLHLPVSPPAALLPNRQDCPPFRT